MLKRAAGTWSAATVQRCYAALRISTRARWLTGSTVSRGAALLCSAEDFNKDALDRHDRAMDGAALLCSAEDFNGDKTANAARRAGRCSAAEQR